DVPTAANELVPLGRAEKEHLPHEEQMKVIRFVQTGDSLEKLITVSSTASDYKSGGATEEERRDQIVRMIHDGVFLQRVEEQGGRAVRVRSVNHEHPLVQHALQATGGPGT